MEKPSPKSWNQDLVLAMPDRKELEDDDEDWGGGGASAEDTGSGC